MKNSIIYIAIFVSGLALFTSCDDEVIIPNEEEVITTLRYTLTPVAGGNSVTLSFTDLDGDGGSSPVVVNGTLNDSTEYSGALALLNETESPAENITEEIEEEDEDHMFFFESNGSNLAISYDDQDSNGDPIGLESTLTTGAAGTENLTITLRHEPNKSGTNVSAGDITNAGGETDIEVTFEITIQ